jgi:hypothetical protein
METGKMKFNLIVNGLTIISHSLIGMVYFSGGQGNQQAKQMKKLIDQAPRLLDK